tara:strand:+ start:181 stop:372 length:192 start_codon:yes stop_codon:yes gene_type:complete
MMVGKVSMYGRISGITTAGYEVYWYDSHGMGYSTPARAVAAEHRVAAFEIVAFEIPAFEALDL